MNDLGEQLGWVRREFLRDAFCGFGSLALGSLLGLLLMVSLAMLTKRR